jgi:hypothetical protein
MRGIAVLLCIGLAVVAACSRPEKPPTGRWIGNYENTDVMVDVRLEILPDGTVKVSAPNITDAGEISDMDRFALHKRLADQLEESWYKVEPRPMDFDGTTFRKVGGVAPQMEWSPQTKIMTLVFYFGMHKSIRIVMSPTVDFSDDPWHQSG